MEIRPLTAEEVDAHLEKYPQSRSAAPAGKLTVSHLCTTWGVVRPVLATLTAFPFIPKRWRDAIVALIQVVDGLCAAPAA